MQKEILEKISLKYPDLLKGANQKARKHLCLLFSRFANEAQNHQNMDSSDWSLPYVFSVSEKSLYTMFIYRQAMYPIETTIVLSLYS